MRNRESTTPIRPPIDTGNEMKTYPALEAMGIRNPGQIARFATFMVDNTDILKITYERKQGSMLPESRKYRFPRLKKSILVDSGTRQTDVIFESSAEFRNALTELEKLMIARRSGTEIREMIAQEVRHLEEDVAVRLAYIKSLVERL